MNPACYILGSNFYIYGTVVIILLRKEKYKSIRINSCCRKSTALFTEITIVNTYRQQYIILAILLHTKLPRTITYFFYSDPGTQLCIIKKSPSVLARFELLNIHIQQKWLGGHVEKYFVSFTLAIHQGLQATASSTTLQSNLLNSRKLNIKKFHITFCSRKYAV